MASQDLLAAFGNREGTEYSGTFPDALSRMEDGNETSSTDDNSVDSTEKVMRRQTARVFGQRGDTLAGTNVGDDRSKTPNLYDWGYNDDGMKIEDIPEDTGSDDSYDEVDDLNGGVHKKKRKNRCVECWNSSGKGLLISFALLGLCLAYTMLGGFLFRILEIDNEISQCRVSRYRYERMRNATTLALYDITKLEIGEEVRIELLQDQLVVFFDSLKNVSWSGLDCSEETADWRLMNSAFFAATVISTIGYGHITPKTMWGRVTCLSYSLIGIPIYLASLSGIGLFAATIVKTIYWQICCCGCFVTAEKRAQWTKMRKLSRKKVIGASEWRELSHKNGESSESSSAEEDDGNYVEDINVPIILTVSIFTGLLLVGGAIFHATEGWKLVDSVYFSFITLSTIGFGDFVPNINGDTDAPKLFLAFFFLALGMATLALIFQLLGNEMAAKMKYFDHLWCRKRRYITDKGEEKPKDDQDADELPPLFYTGDLKRHRVQYFVSTETKAPGEDDK